MSDHAPLRVLIVDDEPLGRQRIEDLLLREANVEIIGQAGDGLSAVEAIRSLAPDLLFLDVQMPGLSGLEVAATVGADQMPVTIFVTAWDQHAVRAFELAAVDYLVKPFDDERFHSALQRGRRVIELRQMEQMTRRLMTLIGSESVSHVVGAAEPSREFLESITVESRGGVRAVPVARIDYITAAGPYAEIHADGQTHLIRERMQNLEQNLDPERFFRVHRSAIVRVAAVDAFIRNAGGDYAVRMKSGIEISVSRNRREELEARLGVSG